jgi:S-adenosylmethionine-dependent methyltransferase
MDTNLENGRFERDASQYSNYLKTPEGRLRIDLAFANLQELLPNDVESRRALDLGGGMGALTLRLAQLGFHVTLLDPSLPMLDLAKRAVHEAKLAEKIVLKHGNAAELASLFPASSFDVVLCHNVLEFVGNPGAVLTGMNRLMRGPSAMLSLLVRSRAGEVLKAALLSGDLDAAETGLSAEWGEESLYGGKVRLFTADSVKAMLKEASLKVVAERGVRVLADYLPSQISRSVEYERIFAFERELGKRQEFIAVARYIQCMARLAG